MRHFGSFLLPKATYVVEPSQGRMPCPEAGARGGWGGTLQGYADPGGLQRIGVIGVSQTFNSILFNLHLILHRMALPFI